MLRRLFDQAAASVTSIAAETAERIVPDSNLTGRLHGEDHYRAFKADAHTCSCGGAAADCCGKQIARADRERHA